MTHSVSLHHVHLVTNDTDTFCAFFIEHFGAEIVFDEAIDGDRNIFLTIGTGRIHLFQSRSAPARERNVFHHIGIMTDDLAALVARLGSEGVEVGPITKAGSGGFAMTQGPDGLLIELFEVGADSRQFFVSEPAAVS